MACVCPPNPALTSISAQVCPEKAGNITRFIFGRESGGAFTDITDEAEFDLRLAAVDVTKIVVTPFLSDVEFPGTSIIETSKDDKTSPFGEGFRTGETSATITAMLKNLQASIKDEMKELECYEDLVLMGIVDSNNRIITIGQTGFIPTSNIFIGTREFGGIAETDNYAVSLTLRPTWDEGLQFNTPTWNPNAK